MRSEHAEYIESLARLSFGVSRVYLLESCASTGVVRVHLLGSIRTIAFWLKGLASGLED